MGVSSDQQCYGQLSAQSIAQHTLLPQHYQPQQHSSFSPKPRTKRRTSTKHNYNNLDRVSRDVTNKYFSPNNASYNSKPQSECFSSRRYDSFIANQRNVSDDQYKQKFDPSQLLLSVTTSNMQMNAVPNDVSAGCSSYSFSSPSHSEWSTGFDKPWISIDPLSETEAVFPDMHTPHENISETLNTSNESYLDLNAMFQFPLNEAARTFPGDINYDGHTYSQMPSVSMNKPYSDLLFPADNSAVTSYDLFSPVSAPPMVSFTSHEANSSALSDWSFSSEAALTDSDLSSLGSPVKPRDEDALGLRQRLQFGSIGPSEQPIRLGTDCSMPYSAYSANFSSHQEPEILQKRPGKSPDSKI